VLVSKLKLSLIRSDRPTIMTRHLMDILFTREEMARSSVTGRMSNKNTQQKKEALDATKVAAILCELLYSFTYCVSCVNRQLAVLLYHTLIT